MRYLQVDKLQVYIADDRAKMGKIAGRDVISALKALLQEKDIVNVMFAAAPSQNDVLAELMSDPEIDWSRVNGFHMDEYIGLDRNAPQGFGNFLKERVFSKKQFCEVFYIDITATDADAEARRYEQILKEHPIDLCILGIGENGHIAFNDPAEANFNDSKLVKVVHLDEICRQQQVNDGCFSTIDDVPKCALTVTVPGLLRAVTMFCVVPTKNKAKAARAMLEETVSEKCPASILRQKNCAKLYLDADAAMLLKK